MFEVFSRSYYLGRLFVTPSDGSSVQMHRDQHERLNEEVYATGDGIERLDAPLVMKLDSGHFAVHGDEGVPANTLAVPESWLDGAAVRNPPTTREVFLARRDRARQLLQLAGGRVGPPSTADPVDERAEDSGDGDGWFDGFGATGT